VLKRHLNDFVPRENCVICNGDKFKSKILLHDVPIYMGVTNLPFETDIFFEQNWIECNLCGCIQLSKLIPLSLLYSHSHNSVIGNIWHKHHFEFMKFVLKAKPENILEIGAGDGYLANLVLKNSDIKYTIIEPNPEFKNDKINLIVGLVENNFGEVFKAETIVHSHLLEHLYNPIQTLNELSANIKIGAKLIFSIPNIRKLISLEGGNSLNFEHTYMLDTRQLEKIMSNLGFELTIKESFLEHSYFYSFVKKNDNATQKQLIPNISDVSKDFAEMFQKLDLFVERISSSLKKSENNYIFGAHVFTQILFNRGLDPLLFKGVLDNSTDKIGKRLYGTQLIVEDPNVVGQVEKAKVVLKATHYQGEIKDQLKKINPNIYILE